MLKQHSSYLILWWLRCAAQLQLMKVRPTIIGVTGSAGKSSTVKAISVVLSKKYRVKASKKGNSETGLPFEILDIPVDTYTGLSWILVCLEALWQLFFNWKTYDIFVAEMGIDSDTPPKNMEYLLSIFQPNIGVFLSVNAVHGENFSGEDIVESIAKEKGKLLTSLKESDTAIYSIDFPQIVSVAKQSTAKKLTFSSEKRESTLTLIRYEVSFDGTTFTFIHMEKEYTLHLKDQLHFRASWGTFASAILIGLELDIPITESIEQLSESFPILPGRMSLIEGVNESWIIDSSYNSSVGPTTAALEMLSQLKGRKIVVLGDMRELGKRTQSDHEQLAIAASKVADEIFLIGPSTQTYTKRKLESLRYPIKKIHSFMTAYQAVEELTSLVEKGDVIFVKGSQNTIFLEIIVKALMKHPENAPKQLSRQTAYWEKQRQKLKK